MKSVSQNLFQQPVRDLGFSLDQIARAVKAELPASELRGMLLMRRTEVEQAIEAEARRLRQLESRLAQIEAEGRLAVDDVVVRSEPARGLLSLRQTVASFADGVHFIAKLLQELPKLARRETLGELVVIAHSSEFEPDNIDAEFGFFLRVESTKPLQLPDGRQLEVRTLPAVQRMATCVRLGPPQDAHLTTARIGQFIEANGYRISGPNREVFLQRPSIDRMHEAVVEMQFPVELS
ncbi:MAG: MerR family transcriptional regulator [Steroidobacteraceae bacterium]